MFHIKRLLITGLLWFTTTPLFAQVWINEIDSDTPGTDDKEFVELRTPSPFTSLNGYTLVFYNGNPTASNANRSYLSVSLDGFSTDANGLILIGNNAVSPVPTIVIPNNVIQNGEDAVAVYQAPVANFPDSTLATSVNVVSALAYDTGDPDAVTLMGLLNIVPPQVQMDENANSAQATESIQRKNDGTYEVKAPTPGAMNDGSGIPINGITLGVSTQYRNEGDSMHVTLSRTVASATPLTLSVLVNNGGFTASDINGATTLTIPANQTSITTIWTIVDDTADEGDEEMLLRWTSIPAGYTAMNNNIVLRVVDNDYGVDPWGQPTQPTYGIVTPQIPNGYYSSLNGLSGSALKQALQNIIADSLTVRKHNYGDVVTILKEADHHPKNRNQVWLMYVETPRAKLDFQESGSNVGKWNREHIYPQSRGGFANATNDIPDGINVYDSTSAFDIAAGHSDAHALRAEDGPENSSRGNRDYCVGDYMGPAGTQNSWRGDVARALMYMGVRYQALSVVSGNPPDATVGQIGDLDSLLSWHVSDPPDDFEMYRNNYIYTWQQNRNPFIDMPSLAQYIYGNSQGQTWQNPNTIVNPGMTDCLVYPNPANQQVWVSGIHGNFTWELRNMLGQLLQQGASTHHETINLNVPNGVYSLCLRINKQTQYIKLQVQHP
jgi:hypothetical protein